MLNSPNVLLGEPGNVLAPNIWAGAVSVDSDRLFVESERIRAVFQQAPFTLVVTVINAVLTGYVLRPVSPLSLVWGWVGAHIVVAGARYRLRQSYLQAQPQGIAVHRWAIFCTAGALTSGLVWGAGLTVVFPPTEVHQVFIAFVIGGMCAGATTVNSSHLPTVLAFVLPTCVPLALRFLIEGSTPQVVAAFMIILFGAAMSITGWQGHRAFGDRIRLQLALAREQSSLRDANERLRSEIEERQKTEAVLHQAQKMEAVGHLTGGMAHDFNNLLQVVSGKLDLIRRVTSGDVRVEAYVQAAEAAVRQGAQLTGSLLAFGRRQVMQVQRVNVNALLQSFRPILLQAIGNNADMALLLDRKIGFCRIDPTHFQSAILNLAINARDAMPTGGRFSISTALVRLQEADLIGNDDAAPGWFVSVAVRDTGCGMPAAIQPRVFDPFFTTKEIGKGSGLGLAQVFGFVRQSGGHVTLHSKLDDGTSVVLFLPAADDENG